MGKRCNNFFKPLQLYMEVWYIRQKQSLYNSKESIFSMTTLTQPILLVPSSSLHK